MLHLAKYCQDPNQSSLISSHEYLHDLSWLLTIDSYSLHKYSFTLVRGMHSRALTHLFTYIFHLLVTNLSVEWSNWVVTPNLTYFHTFRLDTRHALGEVLQSMQRTPKNFFIINYIWLKIQNLKYNVNQRQFLFSVNQTWKKYLW